MRKVKNRVKGFYYTIRNNLFRMARKIKRAYSEAKESHQRKMFYRNRSMLLFIDRWNLGDVFILMIGWILVMSFGYYLMSIYNMGSIERNNVPVQALGDFIYFSFISFTTIGYRVLRFLISKSVKYVTPVDPCVITLSFLDSLA